VRWSTIRAQRRLVDYHGNGAVRIAPEPSAAAWGWWLHESCRGTDFMYFPVREIDAAGVVSGKRRGGELGD